MESISIATCKIHILYMVKNAPGISYQLLMDKCMESLYMDFFNFSQAYNELIAANLMSKADSETGTGEVIGTSELLSITKSGEVILEDVMPSINPQTLAYLTKASAELTEAIATLNNIKAFVDGTSVELINQSQGLRLTLETDSLESAERIANKWRHNGEQLSKSIMNQIL